jgi:hypothetical protein
MDILVPKNKESVVLKDKSTVTFFHEKQSQFKKVELKENNWLTIEKPIKVKKKKFRTIDVLPK